MKTVVLILFLAFLPTHFFAQDSHEVLENLFESKPLIIFEEDCGLVDSSYLNQNLLDYVDSMYQSFHFSIENRLENGEKIHDSVFLENYFSLVDSIKEEIPNFYPFSQSTSLPTNKSLDGPCVNMDFEQGDLSGWTLSRGDVDGSAPYSFVNPFLTGPGPYHQIFGGGVDPVCGIQRVNPLSGNFSVRLGNGTGVGARAAKMSQTFLVDPTNFLFTYSYAVVFQSPAGHSLNKLPYFTVRVFDSLGNNVPCGEYSVIADAANAPNYQTTNYGGSLVLFKDWQSVFVNLSSLIGQNVTIEFTSGDCSLTGHFGYAYVDASCAMQQIIASNSIICQGDSAILTAPSGAGSYLWSNGATTQTTVVYSGGNYSCVLTPFAGGGCSITLDITIAENPKPIADFLMTSSVICTNDSVFLLNNSTIPLPGSISGYKWDFGDGIVTPYALGNIVGVSNTSGTFLNPVHSYSIAGSYSVKLYVISADGCIDSISKNLTVNALPIVLAGNDVVQCNGGGVTLSGSGAVSYIWDNGVTNNVAFVPPVGTTIYTVTGTDANGCVNTDQVSVLVNALPNVVANSTSTILCENSSATLTGSGAVSYVWDNGVTNNAAFVPPIGTTIYTVTGTDANGCVNTDQVSVLVNALPPVIINASGTVFCENDLATLSGSGAVSYVWDNGVSNNVAFVPPVGTTIYTVTGTDANGCVNTDQVSVLVNALPNVVANSTSTILCENSSVTLTGSGAVSYVWDNGVTNNVAFVPPVGTTIYTVTGTDANGCVNTDQINVLVNALPPVTINASGTVFCENDLATLSGSGAVSYVWDNGVSNNVAFVPPVGTTIYTVTGTDANGCVNTDQVSVLVNALPNVVANSTSTILCENSSATLTGSGAVSYVWDNGVTNNVAFVPPVGTTIYTVTGTDVNGCVNTDQVSVLVNALPTVSVIGGDVEICEGEPVSLNGAGASSYSWTGGIQNGVTFYPSVGQYSYTVTGTDFNNCQNMDTVLVLVNQNPIVNAGNDISACSGDTIVLYAQGTSNLSWNNNVINNVPFIQSIGTVTYIVSDTLPTGCFNSDAVVVKINPNPTVSTSNAEVCEGEGVVLYGQGALSYEWSDGILDGVYFYPTTSNDYSVVGTDINGCTGRAVAKVIVNPLPDANFIWLNDEITTVSPIVTFDNTSQGGSTYHWDFNDFSSGSNEFEPIHTFPDDQGGTYVVTLTVTSDKGCVDEIQKYITVEQDYTIFVPNAFTPDGDDYNQFFKPEMTGFDEYDYTLYIFNRWGELIFESHDMNIGWNGTYASGEYGQSQDGVFIWKIMAKVKNSGERKQFTGHVSLLK